MAEKRDLYAEMLQDLAERCGVDITQGVGRAQYRKWCSEFGNERDEVITQAFAMLRTSGQIQGRWCTYGEMKGAIGSARRVAAEHRKGAFRSVGTHETIENKLVVAGGRLRAAMEYSRRERAAGTHEQAILDVMDAILSPSVSEEDVQRYLRTHEGETPAYAGQDKAADG